MHTHTYIISLLITCVVVAILLYEGLYSTYGGGELTVAFLDVGQGDAIFIETPEQVQLLIDGGKGTRVLQELSALVPAHDMSLDMVLATHADADHIGGLIPVLARYRVHTVVHNGDTHKSTSLYKRFLSAVHDEHARVLTITDTGYIQLSESVGMRILWPSDSSVTDANAQSITVQIVYNDVEVLLTGDLPAQIEEHLVDTFGSALESEIVKAGHHGSDTSSSPIFIHAVQPSHAIISAGAGNSYGHPHPTVLTTLSSSGAAVYETAVGGTVVFTINAIGEITVR